jgi:hypothetical protein
MLVKRTFSFIGSGADSPTIGAEDGQFTTTTGPCKNVVLYINTPKVLNEGLYVYEATITYRVNHFKSISKQVPPEYFQVYRPKSCK